MTFLIHFAATLGSTVLLLSLVCAVLHALPRLGSAGKAVSAALCHAPGLDVVVFFLTTLPIIAGPIAYGWAGFLGGLIGMYAVLALWTIAHEMAHPEARGGPRILKINNRMVGVTRNLVALFVTSWAVPVFALVRFAELVVYPPLVWLINLPRYDAKEYVAVSRHKFTGLIGHDRIWCLYCDWMTGVWSLGSEMLRNIESFWCPIKFQSHLKCENCKLDFPDVMADWVPFDSDMTAVTKKLEEQYLSDPRPASNAWFGHPVRMRVKGKPVE